MPLNMRVVPLLTWPGAATPRSKRAKGRFTLPQKRTRYLLEQELGAIDAQDVFIRTWFRMDQIKADGWPYFGQVPRDPGVILTFTRQGQSVSMPCDHFKTFDDNLRAIALSLVALRKVDRYNVTRSGEQYRGFTALPLPKDLSPGNGFAASLAVLTALSGHTEQQIRKDFETLRSAFTVAARKTHPDHGGSTESFQQVRTAYASVAEFLFQRQV